MCSNLDDNDSAAWFYLRWLLGDDAKRRRDAANPCHSISLQNLGERVKVSLLFRRPVVKADFDVTVDGNKMTDTLETPYKEGSASRIWQLELESPVREEIVVFKGKDLEERLLELKVKGIGEDCHVVAEQSSRWTTEDTRTREKMEELLLELENLR